MKNHKRNARKLLRIMNNIMKEKRIQIKYDSVADRDRRFEMFYEQLLKEVNMYSIFWIEFQITPFNNIEEYSDEIIFNDWFVKSSLPVKIVPLDKTSTCKMKLETSFISEEGKKELKKSWIQYTWEDYKYSISFVLGSCVVLNVVVNIMRLATMS